MHYGCEPTFHNTGDDAGFGNRLGWLDCVWLQENMEVGMNGGMARAGARIIIASVVMIAGTLHVLPGRCQEPAPPGPATAPKTAPQTSATKPAAPPAAAPQEPIAPKIDPAKEAKIRKLLDVIGTRALMEQTVKSMAEMSQASLARALTKNESSERFIDLFYTKLQSKLNTDVFVGMIIPIYDKYLTTEDIDGLTQFYESPLGQRALKVLPQIVQEAQAAGFQWGQRMGQEAAQEVIAEHPELKDTLSPPPNKP
jgi:hypothetical protein